MWTLALLAAGLVLLVVLGLRLFGQLRRFRAQQHAVLSGMGERFGLLRARTAALRIAVTWRRHG